MLLVLILLIVLLFVLVLLLIILLLLVSLNKKLALPSLGANPAREVEPHPPGEDEREEVKVEEGGEVGVGRGLEGEEGEEEGGEEEEGKVLVLEEVEVVLETGVGPEISMVEYVLPCFNCLCSSIINYYY